MSSLVSWPSKISNVGNSACYISMDCPRAFRVIFTDRVKEVWSENRVVSFHLFLFVFWFDWSEMNEFWKWLIIFKLKSIECFIWSNFLIRGQFIRWFWDNVTLIFNFMNDKWQSIELSNILWFNLDWNWVIIINLQLFNRSFLMSNDCVILTCEFSIDFFDNQTNFFSWRWKGSEIIVSWWTPIESFSWEACDSRIIEAESYEIIFHSSFYFTPQLNFAVFCLWTKFHKC